MEVFLEALLDGECNKQTTVAIVVNGPRHFIGSNSCKDPRINGCPRDAFNMPSGEWYFYCTDVCKQKYHAEVDAIRKAGKHAKGATLFLVGHNRICNDCREAADKAGIERIIIVGDIICKRNGTVA